jgi:hypothetical protein
MKQELPPDAVPGLAVVGFSLFLPVPVPWLGGLQLDSQAKQTMLKALVRRSKLV